MKIGAEALDAYSSEFAEMLARVEGEGVRKVIVNRRRASLGQQIGILALMARGVRVMTAAGEDLTKAARQVSHEAAIAYGRFEKARQVHSTLSALRTREDRRRSAQAVWREKAASLRAGA